MFSAFRRDADLQDLSFTQISTAIRLLSVLKDDILLCQPHYIPTDTAPSHLPPSIQTFVSEAVGILYDRVPKLWGCLKGDVWALSDTKLSLAEQELFRVYGWRQGLTALTLYPPTHHCSNPDCSAKGPLKKPELREIIVYTQGEGAVPAHAVHLYCRGCKTNYHHNYSVQGGIRQYYGGTPRYIQIGEHQFAERKLVGLWVASMLFSWTSATNCARIYDMALSEQQERDFKEGGWRFGCTLTTENVWDAFVILTLLDYHDRCGTQLQVPHDGEQKTRFEAAMRARNLEVIKEGQDEIAHCCDKCMRVYKGPDGTTRNIQLVIGDGLSMGCRRCQVAHCTTELASNRHRFCPVHKDLDNVCSIVGCDARIVPGKKSCADPAHQKVEELHFQRGKAAFTLRERLQKHRQLHPHDQATALKEDEGDKGLDDEGEEWFMEDGDGNVAVHRQIHPGSIGVDDSVPCEAAKSDTGNRKYKALFGGVRTHNEQILVRPCGVICSRATFYNAEAVSNVLLHVQKTFLVPRAIKPEHFVYDTNCDARQQVLAHPEHWAWFLDVGMSVDVFHFLNKHQITHLFCQEHCNPAKFPELMGPDGKTWFFNTSIAEQTNVWLGGYHSMCREMLPVKYNFFLDEMIRLRNDMTVAKLAADGFNPRERTAV
ncbi:hypothetical protein DFH08DRAFT_698265 [Mycena albidolilacea]|uniref:CxC5 like cysteine cluster associated with KDZ domain-containing protein n=1 Tax=Mycena albidolilacea TaxID=1033008 RepID=A0AAD7ERP7_9AGAR|nr:hypothetical protein DFH08DRAFT_698265 [Mycena albidolilacea]